MFRRVAQLSIVVFLLVISLPLHALRSLAALFARPAASAPPAPVESPHQFAFDRALPAYESLIDSVLGRQV